MAQIVVDALSDAEIGVNTLLDGVPRVTGHDQPPAVETFVSVFTDDQVAQDWPPGGVPNNWPALIVGPDRPARSQGEKVQGRIDAEGMGIAITYATGVAEDARAMREGAYTIRAAGRTITKLLADANADLRNKNNLQVWNATERQIGSFRAGDRSGRVTAGLTVRFNVRDLKPGG